MEIIIVIGVVLYLILCAALGVYMARVVRPKMAQRRFEREVEAEVRGGMAYLAAQKKAADKVLRERGERP